MRGHQHQANFIDEPLLVQEHDLVQRCQPCLRLQSPDIAFQSALARDASRCSVEALRQQIVLRCAPWRCLLEACRPLRHGTTALRREPGDGTSTEVWIKTFDSLSTIELRQP